MSLVNNSANNFKDFLDAIKPYLNYQFYDLSGQGVEANNFSTDEKVIGTWIDGKPLYQKCVTGTTNNEQNTDVPIDLNIDSCVSIKGGIYRLGGLVPFGFYNGSVRVSANFYPDVISIRYDNTGLYYSQPYIITLQYTKTTDTAVASGEKIVGQWIDGKPLYEKTLSTGDLGAAGTNEINHNISNLDNIIYIEGFVKNQSGTIEPLPFIHDNSLSNQIGIIMNNTKVIILHRGLSYEGFTGYVTLRYTKTTD